MNAFAIGAYAKCGVSRFDFEAQARSFDLWGDQDHRATHDVLLGVFGFALAKAYAHVPARRPAP